MTALPTERTGLAGFVMVEVLVAAAVLSLAAASMYQAMSQMISRQDERIQAALALASLEVLSAQIALAGEPPAEESTLEENGRFAFVYVGHDNGQPPQLPFRTARLEARPKAQGSRTVSLEFLLVQEVGEVGP